MAALSIFIVTLTFAGILASITHPLYKTWLSQKEAYKIRPYGDTRPQPARPIFIDILTCKLRNSMGAQLRGLIYTYRIAFVVLIGVAIWAVVNF